MAKAQEVTIEVKAKLGVDQRTAEMCLMLLETYCNANDLCIKEEQTEGNGVVLLFRTRRAEDGK